MLHASAPEPLPFAPKLQIRSFAIERPEGNLLIYGAPHVPDLGGITAHYLNHWHEASFAAGDAPRFIHERDADHVPGAQTFAERTVLGGDFEIIPTPGHTPGATAFLWNRHLFTGDTVFLRDGEWVAAVLDDSDPDAYIESLELMKTLEFDVLVPWASTGPYSADASDARERLDQLIRTIRERSTARAESHAGGASR
jgi:glyoxylase-like metal-dependent hydrolase (beta-lactamase superfamily II)